MILNFAHRGFSGLYPENTMLAYEKAVEAGCDGIELDVHLSADGELVLIHDERVDRTADGCGFVGRMTLKELRQLDVSAAFRGQYGVNRIPTLKEYLAFAKDSGIRTNIELKTGIFDYEGIEEMILAMTKAYGMEDRVIYSSFNHYSIQRLQKLSPSAPVAFLCQDGPIGFPAYAAGFHVDAVHPWFVNLRFKDFMEESHRAGLKVNTWTVNEEEHIRMCTLLGVDAVITNYPDRAQKVISEVLKNE